MFQLYCSGGFLMEDTRIPGENQHVIVVSSTFHHLQEHKLSSSTLMVILLGRQICKLRYNMVTFIPLCLVHN